MTGAITLQRYWSALICSSLLKSVDSL